MRCRPGEFGGEPSCEAEFRLALVGNAADLASEPVEFCPGDPTSGLADADEVNPPRTGCVAAAEMPLRPLRAARAARLCAPGGSLEACVVAIMGQQWGGCSPAAASGQRRPTSC